MTEQSFRSNPECVARIRDIFADPLFAQMIAIIQSENEPMDVPLGSDAIVSVRAQSQQYGVSRCLRKLMEFTQPWETEPVIDERATYGLKPEEMPEE